MKKCIRRISLCALIACLAISTPSFAMFGVNWSDVWKDIKGMPKNLFETDVTEPSSTTPQTPASIPVPTPEKKSEQQKTPGTAKSTIPAPAKPTEKTPAQQKKQEKMDPQYACFLAHCFVRSCELPSECSLVYDESFIDLLVPLIRYAHEDTSLFSEARAVQYKNLLTSVYEYLQKEPTNTQEKKITPIERVTFLSEFVQFIAEQFSKNAPQKELETQVKKFLTQNIFMPDAYMIDKTQKTFLSSFITSWKTFKTFVIPANPTDTHGLTGKLVDHYDVLLSLTHVRPLLKTQFSKNSEVNAQIDPRIMAYTQSIHTILDTYKQYITCQETIKSILTAIEEKKSKKEALIPQEQALEKVCLAHKKQLDNLGVKLVSVLRDDTNPSDELCNEFWTKLVEQIQAFSGEFLCSAENIQKLGEQQAQKQKKDEEIETLSSKEEDKKTPQDAELIQSLQKEHQDLEQEINKLNQEIELPANQTLVLYQNLSAPEIQSGDSPKNYKAYNTLIDPFLPAEKTDIDLYFQKMMTFIHVIHELQTTIASFSTEIQKQQEEQEKQAQAAQEIAEKTAQAATDRAEKAATRDQQNASTHHEEQPLNNLGGECMHPVTCPQGSASNGSPTAGSSSSPSTGSYTPSTGYSAPSPSSPYRGGTTGSYPAASSYYPSSGTHGGRGFPPGSGSLPSQPMAATTPVQNEVSKPQETDTVRLWNETSAFDENPQETKRAHGSRYLYPYVSQDASLHDVDEHYQAITALKKPVPTTTKKIEMYEPVQAPQNTHKRTPVYQDTSAWYDPIVTCVKFIPAIALPAAGIALFLL